MSDIKKLISLYEVGVSYAKGKYILYLSEEMSMLPDFWMKCMEPLKNNNKVGAEILFAEQCGEYQLFKNSIYKGQNYLKQGEGLEDALFGLHTMSYALVWRRKRYRETKKYNEVTTSDSYFFMEMSLLTRMLESDTIIVKDHVLCHEVSLIYHKSFLNLKYPIERLAFLRGVKRYFETVVVKRKIDLSSAIPPMEDSENNFLEFILDLKNRYEKRNDFYTAKRYEDLAKSLLIKGKIEKK
jgi:hypothetical protein